MDLEYLGGSDEEEDDEMMLFVFPALYLASIGTSNVSAAERISEVLEDERGEGYYELRVKPHILQDFSDYLRSKDLLQNTKGVSTEEKVGMFIYMLSRNANFQKLSDRFEHSRETIHRHIKACFNAIISVKGDFVKPPSTETQKNISSDPRYGRYFENCIGSIDGTHVPVTISDKEATPYRNREGSLTQNMMLACDFDLNFVHVSCGKGSASDAAILHSAIESGFQVPKDKYYLVDGGYANTPSFLAPYSGVPYHTEEEEQRNFLPGDYKELFNYHHAHLHSHIKRAMHLLRMRFPILNGATFYPIETQLKIPESTVVLYNIIQKQGCDKEWSSNLPIPISTRKVVALPSGDDAYGNDVPALSSQCNLGNALRDDIAKRMWADYARNW